MKNTTDLLQKLQVNPMSTNFTLASLVITNLYSNIPVTETRTILTDTLKYHQTDPQTQHELLMWYDVITRQNYFSHKQDLLSQRDGLAMGAPSSGLIAELFLQHMEHVHLTHLSHKHGNIDYFRYVDDILIIFNPELSDIQSILKDFNALHPKLHFTAETERDNTINFLDISIQKTSHNLRTSIYRKPTFTDSIIPYTSNHPTQHKYAAVKYLYHRLNSYDLHEQEYKQELNIIHNILHNNSFPLTPHTHPHNNTKNTTNTTWLHPTQETKHKWVTFTYTGKETLHITNALRIAFRTTNTIENLLKQRNLPPRPIFIFRCL